MSLLNDDCALHFLERFDLKVERRGMRYTTNPEDKPAWRDTIYLTRKTGEQVRGYVYTSDFAQSESRARWIRGLSLVMYAARPWDRFKHDNRDEPITPAALRREWFAWHRLAKPFRAFLTDDELKALV